MDHRPRICSRSDHGIALFALYGPRTTEMDESDRYQASLRLGLNGVCDLPNKDPYIVTTCRHISYLNTRSRQKQRLAMFVNTSHVPVIGPGVLFLLDKPQYGVISDRQSRACCRGEPTAVLPQHWLTEHLGVHQNSIRTYPTSPHSRHRPRPSQFAIDKPCGSPEPHARTRFKHSSM